MTTREQPAQQPSLFDPPFQRHSITSLEAATEIQPETTGLRLKVLQFIRAQKAGATDNEIQAGLKMNPSTERPRRIELERAGLIRNSGEQRKTESGRNAVVWRAV